MRYINRLFTYFLLTYLLTYFRSINGLILIGGHIHLKYINFQQDVFRLKDVFTRIDSITLRNLFPRTSLS